MIGALAFGIAMRTDFKGDAMNYKILVKNEMESKEAQELFFELGAKRRNILENWKNNDYQSAWFALGKSGELFNEVVFRDNDSGISCSPMYKEITLPQLRDLVVLKRNDVGDSNAFCHDNGEHYYITSDSKYYFFLNDGKDEWCKSSNDISYLENHVKPITKKEDAKKVTFDFGIGHDKTVFDVNSNLKELIKKGIKIEFRILHDFDNFSDFEYPKDLERITLSDILNKNVEFRIKKEVVNISIPKPFKPEKGQGYYFLTTMNPLGYSYLLYQDNDYDKANIRLGAWRTEDEIKSVIESFEAMAN